MIERFLKRHERLLFWLFALIVLINITHACWVLPEELRGGAITRLNGEKSRYYAEYGRRMEGLEERMGRIEEWREVVPVMFESALKIKGDCR